MRPRLTISRSAVVLIKAFEGFRAKSARLDDGRWTIGYGHTLTAREGATVSEPDAEALLLYDLIPIAHAVNEHVFAPLTQNQFDGLVSFVFNIGVRNFRGSTTLRRLNEGRPLEAALAMELWRKADLEGERIVVDALVRRRAAEKALFLRPMEGWTPAPTSVLPPKIDYDVAGILPLQTPIATHAPMAGDRAYAERATETAFKAPEEPSATAVAAAAVIERLEAILERPEATPPAAPTPTATPESKPEPEAKPEPKPEAKPAAEPTVTLNTPAKTNGPETPFAMPFTPLMEAIPRRRRRVHPLAFVALAAIGIGLFLIAGLWTFQAPGGQVLGVSAETAGVTTGILGVVCLAVAIYFLLERLGLPRDRK